MIIKKSNIDKIIYLNTPISVKEFSKCINIKPFKIISYLMEKGIFSSINDVIDDNNAINIAKNYGYKLMINNIQQKKPKNPPQNINKLNNITQQHINRVPVVCIMGHVDHGKTTLLSKIRKNNIMLTEAGGITQYTIAYQINYKNRMITFIDTPGHSAFEKMRKRGANITDIAVLVVSAKEGFMPQTLEALKFIKLYNVPLIVAITKSDLKNSNIDLIKKQMQKYNITSEDWGGSVQCVSVSAINGENINLLLDMILLEVDMLELDKKKYNQEMLEGFILESKTEIGIGITANIIVKDGIIKPGYFIILKDHYFKIRSIMNDKNIKIIESYPSQPVKIIGWEILPKAGQKVLITSNIKVAKKYLENNKIKQKKLSSDYININNNNKLSINNITDLLKYKNNSKKVFKIILKSDVQGTIEAILNMLKEIKSNKIYIEIIKAEVGGLNKNDIISADTYNAIILLFNQDIIDIETKKLLKQKKVEIIKSNIIYNLIDQVKQSMELKLGYDFSEEKIGEAKINKIFTLNKKNIAGTKISEGYISKSSIIKIYRNNTNNLIYTGKITVMKRFKDNVSKVNAGYECGMQFDNFNNFQVNDIIYAFQIIKKKQYLF